jgi:hypothetical protein
VLFGVESSKPVHQRAEVRVAPRDLADGPSLWAPGRVTLTRQSLSCIASRAGGRRASFDVPLTDIVSVEVDRTVSPRVVVVRTPTRTIELRVPGAGAFARRLTSSRDQAHQRTTAR